MQVLQLLRIKSCCLQLKTRSWVNWGAEKRRSSTSMGKFCSRKNSQSCDERMKTSRRTGKTTQKQRQPQLNVVFHNKCIRDDTKAAARQSLNCIKNKTKNKTWRKTIFNMADGMWHVALESWQWIHQAAAPCNVIWDDMPLNSPKRPPYWNFTSGFHFHTSPQSTCHSVPVC